MMDVYTFNTRIIKKVAKSIVMTSNTMFTNSYFVMVIPILLVVTFLTSKTTKSEEKNDNNYLTGFVIKSEPSRTPTNTPIPSEHECGSISSSFEDEYELIDIK